MLSKLKVCQARVKELEAAQKDEIARLETIGLVPRDQAREEMKAAKTQVKEQAAQVVDRWGREHAELTTAALAIADEIRGL